MSREKWLEAYRSNKDAIWIKCKLTNGEDLFFDEFNGWKTLKTKCETENIFFEELSLQFRSHKINIDISDCDGVYLIRSVMGQIGSDSKNYFTTGKVINDKVHKKMWLVPELITEKEFIDDVEECFAEAIIYDKTKKNREKQI